MYAFITLLAIVSPCLSQDWQPVLTHFGGSAPSAASSHTFSSLVASQYQPSSIGAHLHHEGASNGQCGLYKVAFNQDHYFQYVQYKVDIPKLTEFTLCLWNKFTNHSNDHPLFSYSVEGHPRAIYSWVSNSKRSSYYSLSVDGHTFYRLNYPLRLNRWYHTCQSWNGKTGEWQIWVNAERVGRGFHNRLVGHKIPGGGVAISGIEQTDSAQNDNGNGNLDGYTQPGLLLGEITMLQLYKVALTAGKAHKDHKHHHAHKYDHNGAEITTTPSPTAAPRPTQPTHPLLTGGQLNPGVALNIAAQQPQIVQGQQFNAQYANGQFAPALVTQQLTNAAQGPQTFQPQQQQPQQVQQQQQQQFLQLPNDITSYSQQSLSIGGTPLLSSGLVHSTASGQLDTHNLFKRAATKVAAKPKKRELVLAGGHLIDDSLLATHNFDQSLLDGLAGIGENEPILQEQMKMDEREPAEAEVKAVMSVCSGCDAEPFGKALILGWRNVDKKLYSGAVYTPANNECRVF